MSAKLPIDAGVLKTLYYRYSEYATPLLVILVCLVLFAVLIVPQMRELLTLKNEDANFRKKVTVLRSNLDFLSSLNEQTLDSDFAVVSQALPTEKDFGGVLTAISSAAGKSGVALGDFAFQVGELSTKSAQLSKRPSLAITLSVNADVVGVKRFLSKLSETLPLSEVLLLETAGRSSTLTTLFYYKPFVQQQFDSATALSPLGKEQQELLEKLVLWQRTQVGSPSSSLAF